MRIGPVVLASVVLVGACVSDSSDTPSDPTAATSTTSPSTTAAPTSSTSSTFPGPDLVEIPASLEVDPGVLDDVRFSTESEYPTFFSDLFFEPGGNGATVEATSCEQRAPGRWLVRGTIDLGPGGSHASLGLRLGFLVSDLGTGFPFRASATGSGEFAFIFDVAEVVPGHLVAGLNERGWDYCHLEFLAADVPVQWGGAHVNTTRTAESLTWLAPADSVQALGIGAVLADREDSRVSWAYSTYRRESLPFDAVWLPPDGGYSLGSWDVNDDSACRSISMQGDETIIAISQDCEGQPSVDGATPSILEGWFRGGGETYPFPLSSQRGGAVISIYPRSPDSLTEERVALIAASLVPWRNLWYEPPGLPAGADTDLDTAVSNTLGRRWIERGRFPLGDGWIVVATRIKAIGGEEAPAPAYARVRKLAFQRISSGHWVSRDSGGSAGSDLCLQASGSGGPWGGYVLVFTAEPSWTIQVRRDGIWENLAASDGFYAAAYGAAGEQVLSLPLRALDERGLVVRCSTEGAFLEDGEAWSPYRPAESVRDLPVSVSPATGLEPNATVTVSGSGFYRRTGVVINVCPGSSVIWDDRSDCIAVPDGIGTIRTDREGRFSTQVRVPVTFSTWTGETIDCRIDECVIRVDANTGLHQYGWAPVSFD